MKELIKIQKELKAPKSEFNSFGNYSYRSAEGILEAVKSLLGDAILTISDEIVEVGGRIYVKATATLKTKEGEVSTTAFAREPLVQKGMGESQITGSTSSYARKYALNGLLCIDDIKDADVTNKHDKEQQTQAPTQEPKKKFGVSSSEICPVCGNVSHNIKKGTAKTGKPYEMGNCESCGEKYFINRK